MTDYYSAILLESLERVIVLRCAAVFQSLCGTTGKRGRAMRHGVRTEQALAVASTALHCAAPLLLAVDRHSLQVTSSTGRALSKKKAKTRRSYFQAGSKIAPASPHFSKKSYGAEAASQPGRACAGVSPMPSRTRYRYRIDSAVSTLDYGTGRGEFKHERDYRYRKRENTLQNRERVTCCH